jgi:hypothetical protein
MLSITTIRVTVRPFFSFRLKTPSSSSSSSFRHVPPQFPLSRIQLNTILHKCTNSSARTNSQAPTRFFPLQASSFNKLQCSRRLRTPMALVTSFLSTFHRIWTKVVHFSWICLFTGSHQTVSWFVFMGDDTWLNGFPPEELFLFVSRHACPLAHVDAKRF